MKLFVYDHCPFCTRARMPFGLKNIPLELQILANDDEATPISMVGAKMVPILETGDGYMGESLDIVAYLDALDDRPIFGGTVSSGLAQWLSDMSPLIAKLTIPRTPEPIYPEFETASARAYFTQKKQQSMGVQFDALLAQSDTLFAQMEQGLRALVPMLPKAEAPSIDDIHLFPVLRSLSMLQDLDIPPQVAAYRKIVSQACGVPLVGELRAANR
ncbi:glutaredoxin, GrxB family [Thioclava sp. SK-1]|uniref:glutaredoxin 2 n=1 Tax=Thioclava sp. SK-1 TaxID=1889770 RepID=UPI00082661BE|nr:glutaredoxin 2 [Thioclava sp. SK-1]OCX63089.1 glutaredoxin, GrxB family [Thioclava sp. SK-1]